MPAPLPPADAVQRRKSPLRQPAIFAWIGKGLPTVLVLAVLGGGWMVMHHIQSGGGDSGTDTATASAEAAVASDTLVLPAGKLKAAKFESLPAQPQTLQHLHIVPGRLRYDPTRHVDVKAPMDGILAQLVVAPGDQVASGDLIAVLRSSEIGQARAEILKCKKQQQIAEQILQRERMRATNLQELSNMLDHEEAVEVIESQFAERALGSYRREILSAYAQLHLADELLKQAKRLDASGAISGRTVRERENARQLAETAFHTARDQATFEAQQATLQAEADVADAEHQLNLAYQHLETLSGYPQAKDAVNLDHPDSLSRLEVRAPFAGTVEAQGFANNERVMRGDSLIVLANTDSLTVEASIRESDWAAVSLPPGTELMVKVPALAERTFPATVRYFGREVQTDTNSVPLVAEIDNREGLLRPGMFVRVTIPIGQPRHTLSIKPEAVIQHENQQFVFVAINDGEFKRVDVATGQTSEQWVEVTAGLSPGQLVVTQGAFLLKSELLLQGE